jgi:hypothetical protein
MSQLHSRLERLHAKVRETIALEVPGVPVKDLRPTVCMPYPADDKDMVYFYGDGVAPHADFDYASTRLSDLLHADGIETAFAHVTRAAYEQELAATPQADLPERRFVFLAHVCGCAQPPDTIMSCPLFSPAVVTLTLPGASTRAQILVV